MDNIIFKFIVNYCGKSNYNKVDWHDYEYAKDYFTN